MTTYEEYNTQFFEENDLFEDDDIISTNYNTFSDDTSVHYNQRITVNQAKKEEKGYYSVEYFGKKGEKKLFEFYETTIFPKTTIRNAVSGNYYRGCLVGSNDENLFFKVMNSSAPLKNKNPYMLFYENPEQWEKHNISICPTIIKEKWTKKFQQEIKKRKYLDHVKLQNQTNIIVK